MEQNQTELYQARYNEVLKKTLEFELRPIIARYMRERKVSRERAEVVAYEMLRYLTLCHILPDRDWTVTGEVDEMWHTFILFTRRYRQFCESILGEFIDHIPSEEDDSENVESTDENDVFNKYSQTLNDYKEIVGIDPDPTIWPSPIVFRKQDPQPCGGGGGGCKRNPSCGCDKPRGPHPVPNCRNK